MPQTHPYREEPFLLQSFANDVAELMEQVVGGQASGSHPTITIVADNGALALAAPG
jgi:hypothetical protein